MAQELDLGRQGAAHLLPRALQSLLFVALVFLAVTSPWFEREVGELSTVPSGAVGEPGGATATPVASPTDPAAPPTSSATQPLSANTTTTSTVPGAATTPTGGDETVDTEAPLDTTPRPAESWRAAISPEYVMYDVGCARDSSASALDAFFAKPLGPIKGFDGPRVYPLGDGRNLWMLQDTFIDYAGGQTSFAYMDYANTTVLIQDGACFTALQRGTPTHAESFEQGDGAITFERYFWPAGGMVTDGQLSMFFMEMVRDPKDIGPLDGVNYHPVKTWLATYDVATMRKLDFREAPNSGVQPVYGYHVTSDDQWSYLFGNSYLQNLSLEGGYANAPHSATRMYIARVPKGRLDTAPEYWNGTDFVIDPFAAVPFSTRFFTENSMLPQLIDGKWVSATKQDGFTGSGIHIDVADHAWGPYTTVRVLFASPRGSRDDLVTYHAIVLPFLDPSGQLIVSMSQIPLILGADDAPPRYRPNFWTVDISGPPSLDPIEPTTTVPA